MPSYLIAWANNSTSEVAVANALDRRRDYGPGADLDSAVMADRLRTAAHRGIDARALARSCSSCSRRARRGCRARHPLPNSAALVGTLAPAAAALDSAIRAAGRAGRRAGGFDEGRAIHLRHRALGVHDPARPDGQTLYDMASLTKVIALTTLSMMAVEEHKLDLDTPVVHYLPDFARGTGQKSRRHGSRPAAARQRAAGRPAPLA